MGWFDFLKKKQAPVGFNEKQSPAPSERDPEPPARGTPATPEGHEVMAFHALPNPVVFLTKGGVILASFGVAGDDPDQELDGIVRGVGGMLDKELPPARLVNANRAVRIDELFAPAQPAILPFRTPVSWIFHHGTVASLSTPRMTTPGASTRRRSARLPPGSRGSAPASRHSTSRGWRHR